MITLKRYYKYDPKNSLFQDKEAIGGGWICEFEINADTYKDTEHELGLFFNEDFKVSPKFLSINLDLGVPAVGSTIKVWGRTGYYDDEKTYDLGPLYEEYKRVLVPQGFSQSYGYDVAESEFPTDEKVENYKEELLEDNPNMTEEDIKKAIDAKFGAKYNWLNITDLSDFSTQLANDALPKENIVKSEEFNLDNFYDFKKIVMENGGYIVPDSTLEDNKKPEAGYSAMEAIPYFGTPKLFTIYDHTYDIDPYLISIDLTRLSSDKEIHDEIKTAIKYRFPDMIDKDCEAIAKKYEGLNRYNFVQYYSPNVLSFNYDNICFNNEGDDALDELRDKKFKDFTDQEWSIMQNYADMGFLPGVIGRICVSDHYEIINTTIGITENGTHTISPEDDYDGDKIPVFGSVTINASLSPKVGVIIGTKTTDTDGTIKYIVEADDFFKVYDDCDILVFKLSDSDYTRPLWGMWISEDLYYFTIINFDDRGVSSSAFTTNIYINDLQKYYTKDTTSEYYRPYKKQTLDKWLFSEFVQEKIPYTVGYYVT